MGGELRSGCGQGLDSDRLGREGVDRRRKGWCCLKEAMGLLGSRGWQG